MFNVMDGTVYWDEWIFKDGREGCLLPSFVLQVHTEGIIWFLSLLQFEILVLRAVDPGQKLFSSCSGHSQDITD